MARPTAHYKPVTPGKTRRGAVIRIGYAGAQAGDARHGIRLTIAEAEMVQIELAQAIRKAKEAAASGAPESPPASAAALEAA